MKKRKWLNDNKMLFKSKHKTFNKQCRAILLGNQIGDVVYSNYVRAYNDTKCNGFTFAKGYLQEYDLTKNIVGDVTPYIKAEIKKILGKDKGGIVYQFHHWRQSQRIDDAVVLTSEKHKLLKIWYLNRNYKAIDAVNEAIKYVTN